MGDRVASCCSSSLVSHAFRVDTGDLAARSHVDPELHQLLPCALGQRRHERAEHPVGAFHQHDPRASGVDASELFRQGVVRDLDHRAGHLDTGRARADHDEGHPGFAQRLVGATLGVLERADDARADAEGIGQGLEAGRVFGPVVMTEVAVRGASGNDEVVVRQRVATVEGDALRRCVDVGDLGLQHGEVATHHFLAQGVAYRRAHCRGAQPRGGDLIKQRLEQVVIGPVDQGDLDVLPGQVADDFEAAEPAADDEHTGFVH